MIKIVFVTGNIDKWQIANKILTPYGITLEQIKIDTPEIQSMDVEEIAKKRGIKTKNLMLKELYKVFNDEKYDINNFVSNIVKI